MGPEYGPLPRLKGSEVWALELYRVDKGYKGSRVKGPYSKGHGTA